MKMDGNKVRYSLISGFTAHNNVFKLEFSYWRSLSNDDDEAKDYAS